VTSDYDSPFRFVGATIDNVIDVSGDSDIDHEALVRTWFIG